MKKEKQEIPLENFMELSSPSKMLFVIKIIPYLLHLDFKKFTSIYSATASRKILQEEAIIIGVCNCDEFAMGSTNENSVYGKVLNAIDETEFLVVHQVDQLLLFRQVFVWFH